MTAKKDEPASTALAVISHNDFAITQFAGGDITQLRELIADNLGADKLTVRDLERISVPAGGGKSWEVIMPDGSEDSVKEITGVVIAQRNGRGYWERPFEETGGEPPACSSEDGVFGHGSPGGCCAECQLAQFGSDKGGAGRGQACKQMKALMVYRKEDCLPIVITLPPTSLGAWKKYAMRLTMRRLKFSHVLTSFTLVTEQNKDGIKYSVVNPNIQAVLEDGSKEFFDQMSVALGMKAATPSPSE